jgi:hypothetical protein
MNYIHKSQSLNREDIKELCAFYLKQGLITQDTIDKMPNKMWVEGTHALSKFMCLNVGAGAEAEKTTVESSGNVESKESNGGNCESLLVAHAVLEFDLLLL